VALEVNVLVGDDHLGRIDEVASALGRAGLSVGQTLRSVGVIQGSVPDAGATAALKEVAGVVGVEVNREVRLPPPDAPVQ
jgi:hypothetical protein